MIERLGRAMFEAPFGAARLSKYAPELAEMRLAVLDAVKAKSHRASGKDVFPYNLVRIRLRGVPEEQAKVFRSDFLTGYFAEQLKTGLSRSNFRFPEDLRVEIHTEASFPSPNEQWLTVDTAVDDRKQAGERREKRPAARLIVVHGAASQPEIALDKTRTNIGRTAEVYQGSGPLRKNDLAFSENNEINRTVSREHAHIIYSPKTGDYRLMNDRWYKGEANCGLWIVRDGLSQPVHHSTRGTALKPGDEIHLGTAVVRFEAADTPND